MGKKLFWFLVLFIVTLLGVLGFWLISDEYTKLPFSLSKIAQIEPWSVRVGLRVATVRAKIPTVNRVVIVPDAATFLEAIQQWSLQGNWPILIDDKKYTPMFIKRFQPGEVIRLPATKKPLPTGEKLREIMQNSVAKAWNATDVISLQKKWQELGWEPPGVAITWEKDNAWPAAVALAAARGQPLAFLEGNFGAANDSLNREQWGKLQKYVQEVVEKTGYAYDKLGDAIDTVTIVRQMAVKYQSLKLTPEDLAVTDGLARHPNGDRWAVVGWIYGNVDRAVYQAMCAIFLDQQKAFLFDTYPDSGSWQEYLMNEAASQLESNGISVEFIDGSKGLVINWQNLTPAEWIFDLIFVNSKGNKGDFNATNGVLTVKDIPELQFPAAIHFIHSWSATTPDDINTIAGKWLENGAYIYVGSVHEPYLKAFVPPKIMVKNLLKYTPFLISARHLESPPWKITTIGDPLMIVAPPRQRITSK